MGAGLVVWRAAALVRRLEEQQVGELREPVPAKAGIVAIAHAVVAKDVAVVPELLDEGICCHLYRSTKSHLVEFDQDAACLRRVPSLPDQ